MTNETKQIPSWKIVIIFLIVFWPVGLYLLYRRLSGDKVAFFKNSKALNVVGIGFLVFAAIYIWMTITGDMKTSDGLSAFVFSGVGGGLMLYAANRIKNNGEKFKKYISIVVNNKQTSIDNIAAAIPTDYVQATKDLQKMIDMGYFEGAYIDATSRDIILHNEKNQQSDNTQGDNLNEESKFKVVVCKNCGANNKVMEGKVCECEFCGSPLQ